MKFLKVIVLSFSFFIIVSCANREPLPRTKIVNNEDITLKNNSTVHILTEHYINGEVVDDTHNYLNIVSRTDTAKVVGLKIALFATSLFTGGTTQGFSKEDLKGEYIDSVPNKTMDYLTPELYQILKKMNANKDKEHEVIITPFKFKLIYDGLTDDKYDFIYTASIKSGDFYFHCSDNDLDSNDKLKPIDEWENNNYELVQSSASKAINACLNRLKLSENIAKLQNSLTQ